MEILKQSSPTRENLGMLAVMDVLEERQRITQRELANATGLNLKKVNYCLHSLLEKGYVKFQRVRQNPDKRAYLYILTPSGMKMKSRLTYRFLKFTLDFYGKVEERLARSLEDMTQKGISTLLLCGASDVIRIVVQNLDHVDIQILGVLDEQYDGKSISGVPLVRFGQLRDIAYDAILITSLDEIDQVETSLGEAGVPEDKIWKLS